MNKRAADPELNGEAAAWITEGKWQCASVYPSSRS
jgi:hypothetical protein